MQFDTTEYVRECPICGTEVRTVVDVDDAEYGRMKSKHDLRHHIKTYHSKLQMAYHAIRAKIGELR